MASTKGLIVALLVVVVVASVSLSVAMGNQYWLMGKKVGNTVSGQGLWAACSITNGNKKTWSVTCESVTDGSGVSITKSQKASLQATQIMSVVGSLTLLAAMILSIILTAHARSGGPQGVHLANTILLAISVALLLAAMVVYTTYAASFNKHRASAAKQTLGGGYVAITVSVALSIAGLVLCAVSAKKAKHAQHAQLAMGGGSGGALPTSVAAVHSLLRKAGSGSGGVGGAAVTHPASMAAAHPDQHSVVSPVSTVSTASSV